LLRGVLCHLGITNVSVVMASLFVGTAALFVAAALLVATAAFFVAAPSLVATAAALFVAAASWWRLLWQPCGGGCHDSLVMVVAMEAWVEVAAAA